ncbi:hypothetical protein [Nocardiopsis sp. MG754419]|uniref:hypothetical protein n=1 Tax=Nocardiopsis sp. MG754419 TaxID=2259865 RepID=UPI001BACBEF5|nr:hypothetical protein [Nocardiopsis sp. MG754419]
MVISPVFLVLVPSMSVLVWMTLTTSGLPTMGDLFNESVLFAAGMGATMFAVTTFPALREVRHSEPLALPLSPGARMAALALAAITITTALMGAFMTVFVLTAPAPIAGTPQPAAFAGVFVIGWCGPLGAVASALWTRSYAPLIALGLLVPLYLGSSLLAMSTRADVIVNRMGAVFTLGLQPLPLTYPDTLATALLYLTHAVLSVLLTSLLILAVRRRPRFLRPVALGAVGLAGFCLFGVHTHAENEYSYDVLTANARPRTPSTDTCEVRDGLTYCPLPGYASWVEAWHTDLAPVLEALPDDVPLPTVWQANLTRRADVMVHPPRDGIVLSEHWIVEDEHYRSLVRSELAAHALGLPLPRGTEYPGVGQARTVVAAWLVTLGEGLDADEELRSAEWTLMDHGTDLDDLRLTHAVLSLPDEHVAAVVTEHWDTLAAPETDTAVLAERLGLSLEGPEAIPAPDWRRSLFEREWVTDEGYRPPWGY